MANFLLLLLHPEETGTAGVPLTPGNVPHHLCTAASGGSSSALPEEQGEPRANLLGTPWPGESQRK